MKGVHEEESENKKNEPAYTAVPPPHGQVRFLEKAWEYRHYILHSLLLILLVVLIVWHNVKVSDIEKAAEARRAQLVQTAEAQKSVVEATLLTTMAYPLAWAVRSSLLKGGVAEIDEFATRFVTRKGVRLVAVAKEDGTIIVSSDKKLEKQPLVQFFPPESLEGEEPKVIPLRDGNLVVAAPVMGFAARAGTVAVLYVPEKSAFQ